MGSAGRADLSNTAALGRRGLFCRAKSAGRHAPPLHCKLRRKLMYGLQLGSQSIRPVAIFPLCSLILSRKRLEPPDLIREGRRERSGESKVLAPSSREEVPRVEPLFSALSGLRHDELLL